MSDVETQFLCRPCAEAMKSFKTVASVQIGPHKRVKQLCEQCGRSRYGYLCDVTFKDPEPLSIPL